MNGVIHVIPQRMSMDCGIAAAASVLGLPYEVFSEAILITTNGKGSKNGLTIKDLQNAASALGFTFVRRRKYDFDEETGVLSVRGPKGYWHFVVLKEGQIVDPSDGTIWSYEVFLTSRELTAHTLLVHEVDA